MDCSIQLSEFHPSEVSVKGLWETDSRDVGVTKKTRLRSIVAVVKSIRWCLLKPGTIESVTLLLLLRYFNK